MDLVPANMLTVSCLREEKFSLKTSCPICKEEFDPKLNIPKVLNCGHSICVNCLKRLLESVQVSYSGNGEVFTSLSCPICRASMETRQAKSFPNNFQLLDAIAPEDARIMTCPVCKLTGAESSFHICRECTIENYQFDIREILNEKPPIHPDNYTICSTCVLKEHNKEGHTVISYVPVRLDHQFKTNKKSVDVLKSQMTEKFSSVRVILTTIPQLVAKKEAEINRIVALMERAKSLQSLDKIFEKYKMEMNEIINILNLLIEGGGKLNEMVEIKLKNLEKANEEIDAKHCFAEKINLLEVLKIKPEEIEDAVVELEEPKTRIQKIKKLIWNTVFPIWNQINYNSLKILNEDIHLAHQKLFIAFIIFYGFFLFFKNILVLF
ncbi:hypothetical protein CRE_03727 [Caenorhabditis remanei]|uniref:RING-type domain-containing protein n=1 Tax=Caenorhabditis remanei TaxID=31234 RepID=E3LXX4_CAERE|nr:hypothetical protein CRE_03727 [Caenorhabditis remanei]